LELREAICTSSITFITSCLPSGNEDPNKLCEDRNHLLFISHCPENTKFPTNICHFERCTNIFKHPLPFKTGKKKKRITHITKQAFSQNGIAVKVEREIKNKTCFCKFNYA
jgi:hypothetical protein